MNAAQLLNQALLETKYKKTYNVYIPNQILDRTTPALERFKELFKVEGIDPRTGERGIQ